MKKIVAALILTLGLAAPVHAGSVFPFHVIANSIGSLSATGWKATIQVRPYSDTSVFAWAGGYLADGTFVQNGLVQPGPTNAGVAQAFVWFQKPNTTPLYISLPTAAYPAWYEFHAEKTGSSWTFFYIDPSGVRHDQLTASSASNLSAFQVDAEPWMEAWGPFPTQAMRAVKVRVGSSWVVPHLAFGPSEPICGEAEIYPTPGLNLVFRSTAGGSPCYVVLS